MAEVMTDDIEQQTMPDATADTPATESGGTAVPLEEGESYVDSSTDTDTSGAAPVTPDEMVVSIGDEKLEVEEDTSPAPTWVRDLRKNFREAQRKNRELEAKLTQLTGGTSVPTALPPKPKFEDYGFESDQFEPALAAWLEKKTAYENYQARHRQEVEARENEWKTRLAEYNRSKASLKVRDYDDAEAAVLEKFSVEQQSIMVQGSDNPALVVYALGKNNKRAAELAKIADPIQFAVAIGKLENQLKVTPRKTPPAPPPTPVSGTAPVSGTVDRTLEKLREEAARTGDFTKVLQHKRAKSAR